MTTPHQANLAKKDRILPLSKKLRTMLITAALIVSDMLALVVSFFSAFELRFRVLPYFSTYDPKQYAQIIIAIVLIWLLIFAIYQLYTAQVLFSGMQEYSRVFGAVTTGMLVVISAAYLTRQETLVSRGWLMISWTLVLFFVVLERFIFRRLIFALRRRGHLLSPAVIVGTNMEGLALAKQLQQWDTSGLYLLGIVGQTPPDQSDSRERNMYLGGLENLGSIIHTNGVQDVIVAQTALTREELLEIFQKVTPMEGVNLRMSSGLFEIVSTGLRVKELAYVPLVEVAKTRISGLDALMKNAVDYGLTSLVLMLGWPILAAIALLIKIDSPGPVIHRRRVMGVNGAQFDAFKFRTMVVDGDHLLEGRQDLKIELEKNFKLKDDPRVTRLGMILRKYSLDELPQLFNILRGEMSLVGPRMISPPEMEKYGKWGMNLLTVKPGLTGLWQVSGRSDIDYEERVQLDMHYIRNWTIWQDLYLMAITPAVVLRKKGAY